MSTELFRRLTRWLLYLLIASIGVGALLAIVVILGGRWGWFELRVLWTTAVIGGGSVAGMACGAAVSRSREWLLPVVGLVVVAVAVVLLLGVVWLEDRTEAYLTWTSVITVFAAAFAHASLVSLPRLRRSFMWAQYVAYGLIFLVAVIASALMFSPRLQTEAAFRFLAAVGILDAAFTLLVPVLSFLSRRELTGSAAGPADPAEIDAEIARLRTRIAELEAQRSLQ